MTVRSVSVSSERSVLEVLSIMRRKEMQTDMKIDLEEVLRKIADAVNSLRAYHMASELVIGMPEWLYNKIQEKRCDACGMQAEGYPRLFGITVIRLPMSHCVWVGKKIELKQYKEGEF